ncbi:flagellar basal body rod protein FlgC [Atopococcus tabaci]|uniref:flagellar basal body rod protein FlgC n=1 Tax=Atopococcus tabaci TaxID=269774 RepID=UPI0004058657|nr:flagellar basal body rod protein FlgC [Atopococcus tabaci]
MGMFDSMQINTSGLSLERLKLDVISSNIANANTTRTEEGGPYIKKDVAFEEAIKQQDSFFTGKAENKSFGVRATEIVEDETNTKMVFDPAHPDADEAGYVEYPNVDMADEMVQLMTTLRSYDANVTAMNASKAMLNKALEISK